MKSKLVEGQLVLCTVTKIVGTIVFTHLEDYNKEGTITFSEISPGRIRNIREFVIPNKKIVCKVLEIRPDVVYLSLRRVKMNEKNEFNDKYRREKSHIALLKTLLGDKAESIISKIKEGEESIVDFMEESKEKIASLEKYLPKEIAEKISVLLKGKKVKETVLSKRFSLSNKSNNGITIVKNTINETLKSINEKGIEISYIAAGRYLAKMKSKDPKRADSQLSKMLEELEKNSKKNNCSFNEEK